MKLTQKVKEIALANNLDYIGITLAESLQNEPEGEKPADFLPGAKTVISLGIKLSLGVQVANKLAHNFLFVDTLQTFQGLERYCLGDVNTQNLTI